MRVLKTDGILLMAGTLVTTWILDLDVANRGDHTPLRLLGVTCTIPLILIVIVDWGWKKVYDERDLEIERKVLPLGIVGAFAFLAGAAAVLGFIWPLKSISISILLSLIYMAYFAYILVSSVAALAQYR